ncbi:unnamed protein product [Strongylus vulgaris]|uniref:Uncharacterized protein n=1 Tax=Strongylus vulgaris TaxID=40348 RepID=A0A3P7I7R1_STRVU|nr:unnamed protein product [Strongylus vulgaris]
MNSGEADGPACPVAIHPYGMSSGALTMSGIGSGALQMGPITSTNTLSSAVGLPTGLALGNIDITNSWCQFPGYHDIRPIDHGSYDPEIPTINYQDISSTQKYEPLKYDYGDIRPKPYEEQRLYHKVKYFEISLISILICAEINKSNSLSSYNAFCTSAVFQISSMVRLPPLLIFYIFYDYI